MDDNPLRILIVGGGITGMAAAYRLQKRFSTMGRGVNILLTESSSRLGGLIATQRREDFLLEDGPDCFQADKPRGRGFCQDIQLDTKLIESQLNARQSMVLHQKKLYGVPMGFQRIAPTDLGAMLLSPVLSLHGKFDMLKDFWCPATTQPDETISAFVKRRFGSQVLERLAQPMVSALYGGDTDVMSLRASFPMIAEQDRQGSFFKQAFRKKTLPPIYNSFPEGMQTLIHHLGSQLTTVGARLQTSVRMLEGQETGWKALLSSGEELLMDGICLAVPAPTAATIVMDMDPELYKILTKVPCADSIGVYFGLPEQAIHRKIQGSGFVVPAAEKRFISACTFAHRQFENRAPKGMALLRVFASGKNAAGLWNQTDAYIEKRLYSDLKEILDIREEPRVSYLKRYRQSLPYYITSHEDRMATINNHLSALPGFVMAGNWNSGISVPDCIESGERAADRLVSDLCPSS